MKVGDSCNNEEIANAFAQYFQSVFVFYSQPFSAFDSNSRGYEEIGILSVDQIHLNEIKMSMKNLKSKTTVGSDGIPSYIVKGCKKTLVNFIFVTLFQSSNFGLGPVTIRSLVIKIHTHATAGTRTQDLRVVGLPP